MARRRSDFYREILENMYDGVYFVDRERCITFWNKAAERISGYPAEKVIGSHCYDNILNHVTENGTQLCLTGCPLHATIQDGKPREAEVFLRHANGHRVPVLIRTTPLRDEDGVIIGAIEVFSDNSRLFRRVKRLEQAAHLDPLTRIANRRYMESRLELALVEFQQHRIPFGVLFLDIDYFKRVNDTFGHEAGDRVLQMVANTLQGNIRADDLVARWGGEEFLVLLSNIELNGLRIVAEKLRALVKTSSLRIPERTIQVTVSIGGALVCLEDDIASLLRRADQNMYRAKLAGRDRVICDGDWEGEL